MPKTSQGFEVKFLHIIEQQYSDLNFLFALIGVLESSSLNHNMISDPAESDILSFLEFFVPDLPFFLIGIGS